MDKFEGLTHKFIDGDTFQQLIDIIPDGIIVFDHDGKVRAANHALCSLLNYTKNEILKMDLECFIPSKVKYQHKKHVINYLKSPLYF